MTAAGGPAPLPDNYYTRRGVDLSPRETARTYPQQQPPLERCSSCSGVINQQTGECRCSD